jgi:pimeloyl-ACP methyl ester carboxylesterase
MKTQQLRRALFGACALRLPVVAKLMPTPAPLRVLRYDPPGDCAHKELLVLLPGIGDMAASFEKQGFAAAVQDRPMDVWAVDAHIGYYANRTVLERLHEDVVMPARRRGYRSITLAGISLGGFGSLLYASRYPDFIDRVMLIAPYLGEPEIVKEIAVTGLAAWTPSPLAGRDYERRLWTWLQGYANERALSMPPLFLGFGDADSFVAAHRVLSAVLQSDRVAIAHGGHTWPVWRQLWSQLHPALNAPLLREVGGERVVPGQDIASKPVPSSARIRRQ